MPDISYKTLVMNIFNTPFLKVFFIISVLVAIAFPLYGVIFQMPSLSKHLINNLEANARLTTKHISTVLALEQVELSRDNLSEGTLLEIENFAKDFQLENLKIYSKSGEILYSTNPSDIGVINQRDYFQNVVAMGHEHTNVTEKVQNNLRDQTITSEVIEICLPFISEGRFQGALEINRDITNDRERLSNWAFRSLMLLSTLGILFLALAVLLMLHISKIHLKHAAEVAEFRTKEDHHRAILDNIELGYFEIDLAGRLTFCNERILKSTGLTREQLIGMNTREFMTATSSEDVFKAFNRLYTSSDDAIRNLEYESILPGGERQLFEISATLMKNTSDEPIGFRGIIKDITSRKQTEAELIQARDFLQHIMDSSIDSILTTDLHGNITYCSSNSKALIGYEAKELIGQPVYVIYKNGIEDAKRIMTELSDKGELKIFELQVLKKGGKIIDIILSSSLLKNNKGEVIGTLGIFKDITEKKKMERRLIQAQMLESISTLAGGVAHEFNNALMGITGNMELMKMNFPNKNTLDQFIEPVEKASERMVSLTSQLLAYARGGRYNPRSVPIGNFLKDTLKLIHQDMRPTTNFETDIPEKIANIIGDVAQIQMVLSAVINNASEAMDGKGTIKISVRDGEIDEHFLATNLELKPGFYVCIRIEDSGKGMDEKTKSKIFDPFFTTKFQGRGLGMAAVYGIVTNHEGMISVDSEPGKGTVVRIYLPGSKVEPVMKPDKYLPCELDRGSLNVLVIEDEAMVMDVNREMFKQLSYHMLEAKNGEEAINIIRNKEVNIDLALLDIKLPDMTGEDVYKHLLELRPDMKVIVCSGYSVDGPAQKILNLGADGFIQKPFSINVLSKKIKEVFSH